MNFYIIKAGDTLYQVAQKLGIPLEQLIKDNQLNLDNPVTIGQALVIKPPKNKILVNGYAYPNINQNVLNQTLPYLSYLSIFSYQIKSDGNLKEIEDEAIIKQALKSQVASMMVITNIGENSFDSELVHQIFIDENAKQNLLKNCLSIIQEKNYYGIDIDFEYIYPNDRELYNQFIETATSFFHNYGITVTTALAPKLFENQSGLLYEAHDYEFHGKTVDHIILMTYEWGYTYGPPMAVAPINQIKRVLEYAVTVIPSQKILMGIPNYGYDWTLPYEPGTKARSLSNTEAVILAQKYNATIEYDKVSQAPYFYYTDENDKAHVVWFEDVRSIDAKLNLVSEYHLGGISYWNINSFFSGNWLVVTDHFEIEKLIS